MHEQGAIPLLISEKQIESGNSNAVFFVVFFVLDFISNSDILKNFRHVPTIHVDNPVLLEMQADILLILSCICEGDMHRKVIPTCLIITNFVNILVCY